MTKSQAIAKAKQFLKREPNESFYIMKLFGLEDLDLAGSLLTSESPYDVVRERDFDFVLSDISADQCRIRTHYIVE